jgi:hypothetical protein
MGSPDLAPAAYLWRLHKAVRWHVEQAEAAEREARRHAREAGRLTMQIAALDPDPKPPEAA